MPTIHPTALVDPKAELSDHVTVGPYAVIGPHVRIGRGTTVGPHAVIEGRTTIGAQCQIFAGAVVGAMSQDLKHTGQRSGLQIGGDNIIREYTTISCGTEEGSITELGDGNLIMAYAHVAHDCRIGNRCVIANAGTLAGHVIVEDQAVIGGLAAVHQFVRIGQLAIVGGCSKVVQDVVPFSLCDGHPARVCGMNVIGLRRANVPAATRRALHGAFKILFYSGLTASHAVACLKSEAESSPEIQQLITFVRQSKRGFCRAEARGTSRTDYEQV